MCGIGGIATSAADRMADLRERLEFTAGAIRHRGLDVGVAPPAKSEVSSNTTRAPRPASPRFGGL
jgi:hypothetical protein